MYMSGVWVEQERLPESPALPELHQVFHAAESDLSLVAPLPETKNRKVSVLVEIFLFELAVALPQVFLHGRVIVAWIPAATSFVAG